jgi:hypothetical protein
LRGSASTSVCSAPKWAIQHRRTSGPACTGSSKRRPRGVAVTVRIHTVILGPSTGGRTLRQISLGLAQTEWLKTTITGAKSLSDPSACRAARQVHRGPPARKNSFLRVGNTRARSRVLSPSECRWLTQPDPGRGPGLIICTANATGRCNGRRRLLPEDEQDLGEVLRIELDRLVSLLHPADAITEERAGAQIQGTRARSSVDK